MSTEIFTRFDPGPILEDSTTGSFDEMDTDENPDILRIAVDFGTTFTSVAYARTPASDYATSLMDIKCIARYPGDLPLPTVTQLWEPRQDVPTEIWYPQSFANKRQPKNGSSFVQNEDPSDDESSPDSDNDSVLSVLALQKEQSPGDVSTASSSAHKGVPEGLAWGFEVQKQLATEDIPQDGSRHIARFKLLLHEPDWLLHDKRRGKNEDIEMIKMEVIAELKKLRKLKLIESNTDVITHFLEKLFIHVKEQLQKEEKLDPAVKVEFVLCVPAEWSSRACRIMQDSMATAAKHADLGQVSDDSLDNLFIVSEPEAAAACIIAERRNDIFPGETIIVLDAGGGTVDAVTYEVTNSDPLRLSAEVVPSKTEVCGASYINERYRELLRKKLGNEKYLEKNGKTIDSIIDRKVVEFENTTKRIWDLYDPYCSIAPIWIDDLLPSQTDPQLKQNRLEISVKQVEKIYHKSLKGTVDVLMNQLEMAKANQYTVQKVLLTGGFGQSPFLQSKLRRFLAKQANFDGGHIPLVVPQAASTTVARGAILRAGNKALGPTRKSACSYGFLRSEHYEPNILLAHRVTKPRIDPVDGEKYVHRTIDWMFLKDEELEVGKRRSIKAKHTFKPHRTELICKEVLYVADDFKESHYRCTHAMNKGAEVAGQIAVDMTFLLTEGLIFPEPVSETSAFAGKRKEVYVVEFDLVVIVDGRNLVYEALWPALKDGEDPALVEQQVCKTGRTCIAATFKPGTA